MDKKYLLFDLDGTLTNPKEGITKCARYALKHMGIEVEDEDELLFFIGPPLDETFMNRYGMTKEQAWEAIASFRERFSDIGIFENEVFDGVHFMLETLKEAGKNIVLATSKPEEYALRILEKYGLDKYFDIVVGGMMNGDRTKKSEVIMETVLRIYNNECEGVKAEKYSEINEEAMEEIIAASIMTGDRHHDIDGAHELGMEAIGVTFGYAAKNELEDACADYIVNTLPQLTALLLV